MICYKCGSALQPNSRLCNGCGTLQDAQGQQAPPQGQYPQYMPQQQQYAPPPAPHQQQYAPPQSPIPPQHSPPPQYPLPPAAQQFASLPPQQQYAPQPESPQYLTPPAPPQNKKSNTPIVIAISAVAALVIVLIVFFVFLRNDSSDPNTTPTGQGIDEPTPATDAEEATAVAEATPTPTQQPLSTDVLTGPDIFARNRDAVIIIRTVDHMGHYIGTGSGFFICSTGIAVTNHHVMVDWASATAVLYDNREFTIIGYYSYDVENDLAVIQVDGRGYSFDYVTIGNSDDTRVGEDVFAIGGPDWDPITFTPGMISRIAYEPVNFGIYSIEGLFQSTAAIYGGNSGGPLVNDRGHVIGVNAAGNTLRASVQFAVPINRVEVPVAGSAVNPLPMGGVPTPPTHTPGQFTTYSRFPSIPDFMSVSRNASLLFSGTPLSLGLLPGDIIYDYYDYLFMYILPFDVWSSDTLDYEDVLWDAGFFFQNEVDYGDEVWVYFFNEDLDISVSYAYVPEDEILLIAIVPGDVYTLFYYGGVVQDTWDNEFGIEPDFDLDLSIAGVWQFWDTNDDFYLGLMNAGEDVIYIFETDGTGYWGAIDALDNITHEIPLFWETFDGTIFINFPSIDLLLVYEYHLIVDGPEKDLFLIGVTEHHLFFLEY